MATSCPASSSILKIFEFVQLIASQILYLASDNEVNLIHPEVALYRCNHSGIAFLVKKLASVNGVMQLDVQIWCSFHKIDRLQHHETLAFCSNFFPISKRRHVCNNSKKDYVTTILVLLMQTGDYSPSLTMTYIQFKKESC